jgi:urease accessory protein
MATTMPDDRAAQLRLLAFLSPAFPVGGFAYSHGLERAVHDGLLPDADALREWLSDLIAHGSGWNDAVLFAEAHRRAVAVAFAPILQGGGGLHSTLQTPLATANGNDFEGSAESPSPLRGGVRGGGNLHGHDTLEGFTSVTPNIDFSDLAELAEALAGSEERRRESLLQGAAFVEAARAWPQPLLDRLPSQCAYSVAAGAILGAHGVILEIALAAWLQAFSMNLVQAAIRLGVTGQQGAMAGVAALEPVILETARQAAASTLDDLGSATFLSDIVAMKHETQQSRLFRS